MHAPSEHSAVAAAADDDMPWIEGGEFRMGCERFYGEEAPVRSVAVDGFWLDRHPVTNDQYARFVAATGYVTVAERPLDPAAYPGAAPELLVPGSLVFVGTPGPVPLDDYRSWWEYVPGAFWRQPLGPGSGLEGLERHPVVHVAHEDAAAYAAWCGKQLPTEAEWELAARGGLDAALFAWGDEERPEGRIMANTWQGAFPWHNTLEDGYLRTSPVGSFPANGYGLWDVTGNVWEWTDDWYGTQPGAAPQRPCCAPRNPRGGAREDSYDPTQPEVRIPRKVLKGGSHLCAPNYCLRYRPAARSPEMVDTATSHIGFRCLRRPPGTASAAAAG